MQYSPIFIVASEGKNTEPLYFRIFNDKKAFPGNCVVEPLPGKSNCSPPDVLKRMQNHLESERPEPPYEAWLVVDRDNWIEETQLAPLCTWVREDPANHFLALSNPKFEYWLLLHFEEGDGIGSPQECDKRLAKHLSGYNKRSKLFNPNKITLERVKDAVRRAKKRDKPPCKDWPHESGKTTVYRLVEKILIASGKN